jgi:polyisoprenoid-binding protein YceI
MTRHLVSIVTALLVAGAIHANDKPAPKPSAPPGAVPRYVQAPAGSRLVFGFDQAGAASEGSFRTFSTTFDYDEKNLAASSLAVTVQTASVDTQDADRDTTLKSADLLGTDKYPTATYNARSLEKSAGALQAVGKLTLRGVTKDLRLPLAIRQTATGLELSGSTTIKRLDYGVGQGEWKATDSVGDEIKITYKVALIKAK